MPWGLSKPRLSACDEDYKAVEYLKIAISAARRDGHDESVRSFV